MTRSLTRRERSGILTIATLLFAIVLGVGMIQIFGNRVGAPCRDSYSYRGFLIGGAECIEDIGQSYCTRRCHYDSDCPQHWHCTDAYLTAAAIPLSKTG